MVEKGYPSLVVISSANISQLTMLIKLKVKVYKVNRLKEMQNLNSFLNEEIEELKLVKT